MAGFGSSPLPRSFRGYKTATTDELLREVERSYQALLSEREEYLARLEQSESRRAELEHELAEHRERGDAVREALIRSAQAEADSRRDADAIRAAAEREAEVTLTRARREAEAITRDAELIAARLVGETERELKERKLVAEEMLGEAKERLSSLVEHILEQVTKQPLGGAAQAASAPASLHGPRVRPAPLRESSAG